MNDLSEARQVACVNVYVCARANGACMRASQIVYVGIGILLVFAHLSNGFSQNSSKRNDCIL